MINVEKTQLTPLFKRQSEEVPSDRFEGDQFERKDLGLRLRELLTRLPEGAVMTIDAPWGEGKTWFGRRWHAHLIDEGFRAVYIDCFQQDYQGDPFGMLASAFLDLAKQGESEVKLRLLDASKKVATALLPATAKLIVKAAGKWLVGDPHVAENLSEAIDAADDAAADQLERLVARSLEARDAEMRSVDGFKRALQDMAAASHKPVVVIIDELDRCRPDFAVHTVERIKHFFDVPGIVFVLLVNRIQLAAAVRGVYGSEVAAEAYLAKFVHLSLALPKSESLDRTDRNDNQIRIAEELLRYGFSQSEAVREFAETMGVCGSFLKLSLRDMERAVPLFSFSQVSDANQPYLAWPIALKLAKPDLFKRLIAHVPDAHAEAAKMCAEWAALVSSKAYYFAFFEELHNCGASGFSTEVSEDSRRMLLGHLGRWHTPKRYLTWLFGRVGLSA